MCVRTAANEKITVAFNMMVATILSVFIGIFLRVIGFPCWFVCGSIAVIAVVAEHYLTIHPLSVLKYITFPVKEQKEVKSSKKKAK